MRKAITILLLMVLMFSMSMSCLEVNPNAGKIALKGRVFDSEANPIQNAIVTTIPTSTIVKTDENGGYVINDIMPGVYTLKVSKAGYKKFSETITLQQGIMGMMGMGCMAGLNTVNVVNKDVILEPEAEGSRTGEIYGVVKDKDGNKVSDVKIVTDPATIEVSTDTAGSFIISEVKPGTYKVTFSKDGYVNAEKQDVLVEAGKQTEIEISLYKNDQLGSIKGKVTDVGGSAVEGVAMSTIPATSERATDAQGDYEVTNVAPGEYTVYAVKTGYETGTKTVTVSAGTVATADITITAMNTAIPRNWALVSATYPPSTRTGHSAVLNGSNAAIVFGGFNGIERKNDLWSYNGNSWVPLSPSGTPPAARYSHSAVWSTNNNCMYVFGGDTGGWEKNDLYKFDGSSWYNMGNTPVSSRKCHSAVWDSKNNRMLIFGGSYSTTHKNDLWSYNGAWQQLMASSPISARKLHSAVWDLRNERMLVFGGSNASTRFNDLWAYDGVGWTLLTPTGTPPSPREGHCAVWDKTNNRMLVFGGGDDELWSFDGTGWTKLQPHGTLPSARYGASAVWEPTSGKLFMFGGNSVSATYLSDLWSY